ncbi:cytochrome-c peroxidase [Novosphingobium sp.]|jgi:cytochrome c peroxidase|uniref:cytochrome-c peroxidase n=1 Tax=Novosphingobium sp. TaxID=1874826 RepID=UPI002FE25752
MRHALTGLLLIVTAFSGVMAVSRAATQPSERAKAARIELGRRLFYDADLSINGTMSCATCHEQHHGFADGNRTHAGALDDPGRRNVPTLANVGDFPRLTWADPRLTSLEAQVAVPMFGDHPVEMAMKGHEAEIARRLNRDPCYRTQFAEAFPESDGTIDYPGVATALAAFERALVSRGSDWDKSHLEGQALEGALIFQRNCAGCHSGVNFTDSRYHRIGAVPPPDAADPGLAEVTGRTRDRGRFRTPSLRNITVSAPYLHDGFAPTLDAAIAAHNRITPLPAQARGAVAAFLASLTDHAFLTNPAFQLPQTACGKAL